MIERGNFNTTFYLIGDGNNFSPKAWKKSFIPFDLESWKRNSEGVIQFKINNDIYSLIMNYKENDGISFSYDRYNRNNPQRNFSFISSINSNRYDFELLDSGTTILIGSFVPLEDTWGIVKDFLNNPVNRSQKINWENSNNLDWPEDF